ncbi:MAG: RsmE family RNA methyltransferase [Sediminibacterium sp.]|jgi:16S rRNA (uracil1498-N3)-methyltransferase
MSVPYFYEPLIATGMTQFTLSETSSKHCVQVLRMDVGEQIDITNGQGGLFHATIQVAHKKNAVVTITTSTQTDRPKQKLQLGISLLKNAVRLEWLFEKATEIGVTSITPLVCERTIHERFKTERMQQIIQSAMIQSQQTWLPVLSEPMPLLQFITNGIAAQKLIAHCEPLHKTSIQSIEPSDDLLLLIGPEGDFAPSEIEAAIAKDFMPIDLGPTRLRTETAGIFALSCLKNF